MSLKQIKFKKLRQDAIIPQYQHPGDSGFDFYAIENVELNAFFSTVLIKTGLAVEIPEGFEMQIRPRSGMSLNTGMIINNSPGTIDSNYRGEICILAKLLPTFNAKNKEDILKLKIKKGERIAQGVICPVVYPEIIEVDELKGTERGEGGFGSTGR